MISTRSELLCDAFNQAGIEPHAFAAQLKVLLDRPLDAGVTQDRKQLFEYGLFTIQSRRLIILLGF